MRSLWAALGIACGVDSAPPGAIHPPPVTLDVGPARAGWPCALRATGLSPGASVRFVVTDTSPWPAPTDPVTLGTTTADASGVAWLGWALDGAAVGDWWAVALADGVPGPVVGLTVRAGGVDGDRDGLPDDLERWWGLDPGEVDGDSDGARDGAEWPLGGTDPWVADTDGDGLPDGLEPRLGLDPRVPDTDGDGLDDGDEVHGGTDPTDPDGDGDLAPDGIEIAWGLDPRRPDTDGDGMPDGGDPFGAAPGPYEVDTPVAVPLSLPGASVPDPELEPAGGVAWATTDGGALWLAHLDRQTGSLLPADGRGTLLDTSISPLGTGFNGPEWVLSGSEAQVLYTRPGPLGPVLWRARPTPTGWATAPLPGDTLGTTPFGTLDPADPTPRVLYAWGLREVNRVGWRLLDAPVGRVLDGSVRSVTWLPASTDLLVVRDVDGRGQLRREPVAGPPVALTGDPTWDHFEVRAWQAPELGGERVVALSRGRVRDAPTELALYRLTAGGLRPWAVLRGPAGLPYVVSPEVLLWQGRSWVVFLASRAPRNFDNGVGEVWIVAADPALPDARRLSRATGRVLKDPEPVGGAARPWVIYTEIVGTDRVLWRSDPGI